MLLLALPHLLAATLLPPPSIAGADPPGAITCAALLDERTLLLGRTDGLIVPVDPRTGERIGRDPFARHTSASAELAVDHTGEFVAAASAGGEVALWSVRVERAGGALVVDPILSTFVIDDWILDLGFPDVAYDALSERYLVVYQEQFAGPDIDVYSMFVDSATGATSTNIE